MKPNAPKPKSPKTNFKVIFPQISMLSEVMDAEARGYVQPQSDKFDQ